MALSPRTILKKTRQAIAAHEEVSRAAQLARPAGRLDVQVIVIMVMAAAILSWLDYYGGSGDWKSLAAVIWPFVDDAEATLNGIFLSVEWGRLARLGYWSGTTVIGYFIVPALLIVFVFRQKLSDYGLPMPRYVVHFTLATAIVLGYWQGHYLLASLLLILASALAYLRFMRHAGAQRSSRNAVPFGLTLGLFLIMVPFVVFVAFTDSFQSTYPFYQHADRSAFDFIAWSLIYAAQFFALEFFYRGFLIHGLRHRFGVYSILISMIPYVMIHFGKPLPETLGSIVAGIALGAISYHYRSVWPAIALHVSIAFSMDLFSLSAQGRIFGL